MSFRREPLAALIAVFVIIPTSCTSPSSPPVLSEAGTPVPSSTLYAVPSAGAFPADLVDGLRTDVDVPFTVVVECGSGDCMVPLDVLAPKAGEALPTIVLQPGGPLPFNDRRLLELLAAELAHRGAVVFLATYRSEATGNPESDMLVDVRCSVRFARSVTGEFGGDEETVVLVGHSTGSNLVIQTGVNPDADTPGCLAHGDGIPEAVVGLSEFSFSLTGSAESGPPFVLVGGGDDPYSEGGEEAAQGLRDAGFQAEYREFSGTDHGEMVDPQATPAVIDAIFEAVDLARQS